MGVPADYTAVFADSHPEDINEEVVSVQGNHVFLLLPIDNDSIYLECTSQKLPFGITGRNTQNRKLFSINKNGGSIIYRKGNNGQENKQETIAQVTLNTKGDIQTTLKILSYGNQLVDNLYKYDHLLGSELEQAFKEKFNDLSTITFSEIKLNNNREAAQYETSFDLSAQKYGILNLDGSMLFTPNMFIRSDYVAPSIKNRNLPFEIIDSYTFLDKYTIMLPSGYEMDYTPESVKIENEFGRYVLEISKIDNKTLLYVREFSLNMGEYPAHTYEAFVEFTKKVKKSDEMKLLLISK